MLTRFELLLFNRELLFLIDQYARCNDLNVKKNLYNQINLLLNIL